ncbi:hypothetical protein LDDCCGHA_0870 [Methylobacterium oxalidis]|nr:hypothetical protein LDDCCGHA_0870 [Methylobacterium oxalidis]
MSGEVIDLVHTKGLTAAVNSRCLPMLIAESLNECHSLHESCKSSSFSLSMSLASLREHAHFPMNDGIAIPLDRVLHHDIPES